MRLGSIAVCCMLLVTHTMFAATTISTTVTGHSGEDRSITFTWTFTSGGGDCQKGQFANGDWWVAPAAGQSDVTVTSIIGEGSGQIYCDENPILERMGLLSKNYGNLDTEENIIPKLPVTYGYNTSLVAVIQRDEDSFGDCGTSGIVGCCADAYMVVTVLDAVPADSGANTFRPNITRSYKELMTWDDFDLSKLPSNDALNKGPASEAALESIRKVWSHNTEVFSLLDSNSTGYSEGGRAFRADLVSDDYAATVASAWYHNVFTMMADDHTRPEKLAALAAMLTYAKDIFYNVYDHEGNRCRYFGGGAGQAQGRFPAAVFFAALARDPIFAVALKQAGTDLAEGNPDGVRPVELNQVNIGHNGPIWGDGGDELSAGFVNGYWSELYNGKRYDGLPDSVTISNAGQRTSRDPYNYVDGPALGPLEAYGGQNSGQHRAFAAVMYLMPDVCDIVNYDYLVTYANRLSDFGKWTLPDPCAPPDPREDTLCSPYYVTFISSNPAYYIPKCNCKYYGMFWDSTVTARPTWGPDPDSVAAGNWGACIKNGTDPLTGEPQNGRFGSRHGDKLGSYGYVIYEVENNWDAIRAGRSACTRPWYDRACTSSTAPTVPGNLQAAAQSEREILLSWDASSHSDCGVALYAIRRDGALLDSTTSTTYRDSGLTESVQYSYEVAAISLGKVQSGWAGPATATTDADVTSPAVRAVYDTRKPMAVALDFTEPVDSVLAVDASNYTVDNGITVTGVTVQSPLRVELIVSPLSADVTYRLTVQNITDIAQAANVVVSSPADTFHYLPVSASGGLVGYWSLDETGATVPDGSGNGHDGTVSNAAFSSDGKYGGCRVFDTTLSSTIDLGTFSVTPGGTGDDGLTVGMWVMPTTWSDPVYKNPLLIRKSGSFSLNPRNPGQTQVAITTTTGNVSYRAGGNIGLNTWTHVACTYDGDSVFVYVNGNRVGQTALTGTMVDNTNAVTLSTGDFIGKMDEVYLFDRALTPAEVKDMMSAGDTGLRLQEAPSYARADFFRLTANPVRRTAELTVWPLVTAYRVVLSDRAGRTLGTWNDAQTLDVSGLLPGVYFVTLMADGYYQTARMVVVR